MTGAATVLSSGDGFLRSLPAVGVLIVEEVRLEAHLARVSGRVMGLRPASLRLVGPRGSSPTAAVQGGGDRWSAVLPLTAPSSVGPEELPVPRDVYDLETGDGHLVVAGIDPDPAPDADRPWQVRVDEGRRLRLERGRGADVDDYTRHGQRRLQTGAYEVARHGGRRPWVLLDSFVGRGGWHACAAVAQALGRARPDLELVWSTRDESLPVPPGVTPSLRLSEDWYRRLGGAAHVVANGTLPRWFEKAPGQRVVQLWTGTPVLRFGHALLEAEGRESDVRALDADVAQWDVLCTGGPEATAWLREATGWAGPVHEVGHPALDTWVREDRAERRAEARRRLGLGDEPVLLYAPTTRRAVRAHTRREKIALLDPPALVSAVPGLTVLMRGHPNTANQQVLDAGPGVVDVTHHPELADLLAAADAVVTDYSTLLVDVLASATPVALLVPDREDFEDLGFFPDLFTEPPGPVVTSTEELVPWLTGGLETRYPGREKLRERLLPLDDGHAAERIVEAEFGGR
jgi:CDP-glycerol glycerophosphotransferase